MTACACIELGPRRPDVVEERYVGQDPTEGRFADVTVRKCARCHRLWLRYQYEFEAFTASGRWAEAPIDEATAATMTATSAHRYIHMAPWRIIGGSYFGQAGKRVDSGLDFGTPPDPNAK
jgi:hypothetical protein